ncbi:hypothetical protein [Aliiglaciecola litoralis]|uniref:Zinc ribbon domain-containing protein n=1 Tax=Aliiglaciecola litoralis TaxID=582857 RepID=A0ABN1LLB6_9ALTE
MALIDCPSCNKKISDKAKTCNHCDFAIGQASNEDLQRKKNLKRFQQQQSIQNQSMLAMLLFIGGFALMYWGTASTDSLQYTLSIGCSVVGFVWYIINRIRLIFVKRAD